MRDNHPGTVGAEFESVITSRDAISDTINRSKQLLLGIRSITRDASVESPTARIGNSTSVFLGSQQLRGTIKRTGNVTAGYEIVTNPMPLGDMRKVIAQTINLQVRMGEIYSPRSSIHIHVGFPNGLIFRKIALALGKAVEPIFYKIAGMGGNFRGATNHSAYCRPIALPPAIALADSDKVALLRPDKALSSYGENSFWNYMGISSVERDRYIPIRYMGINIYSTLMIGTMEFRFFNYSSVSRHVEAVAGLSQFITDLMIRIPLDVAISCASLSIFKSNSDQDYIDALREMLALGKRYGSEYTLSDVDYENILDLIRATPQPVFEDKPILSHVSRSKVTLEMARQYGLDIVDHAEPSGFIDIHTFNQSNRCLIGD